MLTKADQNFVLPPFGGFLIFYPDELFGKTIEYQERIYINSVMLVLNK